MTLDQAMDLDLTTAKMEDLRAAVKVLGTTVRKRVSVMRKMEGPKSPMLSAYENTFPEGKSYKMPDVSGMEGDRARAILMKTAAQGQRFVGMKTGTKEGYESWQENVDKASAKRIEGWDDWSKTQKSEFWRLYTALKESDASKYFFDYEDSDRVVNELYELVSSASEKKVRKPDIRVESLRKLKTTKGVENRVSRWKSWYIQNMVQNGIDLSEQGSARKIVTEMASAFRQADLDLLEALRRD